MSTNKIREAAALMRERTTMATDGAWEPFRRGDPMGPFGVTSEHGIDVVPDVMLRRSNAEHIASWHPVVALAVADWLDWQANRSDSGNSIPADRGQGYEQALAVAHAYLGQSA